MALFTEGDFEPAPQVAVGYVVGRFAGVFGLVLLFGALARSCGRFAPAGAGANGAVDALPLWVFGGVLVGLGVRMSWAVMRGRKALTPRAIRVWGWCLTMAAIGVAGMVVAFDMGDSALIATLVALVFGLFFLGLARREFRQSAGARTDAVRPSFMVTAGGCLVIFGGLLAASVSVYEWKGPLTVILGGVVAMLYGFAKARRRRAVAAQGESGEAAAAKE